MFRPFACTCATLLALPASAGDDQLVPVTYDGDLIEGQLRLMPITVSASGARYVEGDAGYHMWIKGNSATVLYGPLDNAAVLLSQCETTP